MIAETTQAEAVATIHPFEAAGLGLAPFRYAGMSEKVIHHADGHSQPAGTCDYCSNGIRYCFHVESSDKKRFAVGCDCIRKIARSDNRLLSEVERAKARFEADRRLALRIEKNKAREAARQAELTAQRERNGGQTDYEVAEAKRMEAEQAKAAEFKAKNSWLLSALDREFQGGFVVSMIRELESKSILSLSGRCIDILREIYAKQSGRKNSGRYNAAAAQFDEKAGIVSE